MERQPQRQPGQQPPTGGQRRESTTGLPSMGGQPSQQPPQQASQPSSTEPSGRRIPVGGSGDPFGPQRSSSGVGRQSSGGGRSSRSGGQSSGGIGDTGRTASSSKREPSTGTFGRGPNESAHEQTDVSERGSTTDTGSRDGDDRPTE
jgi:hypothetical protein